MAQTFDKVEAKASGFQCPYIHNGQCSIAIHKSKVKDAIENIEKSITRDLHNEERTEENWGSIMYQLRRLKQDLGLEK